MLLAIDSGNTNVVFAVYDGEVLVGSWRASSDERRTADEYAVWLTQLMTLRGLGPEDIDGAIIASVVPAALRSLINLCVRYFNSEPLVVGAPGVELGIEVRIDRPDHVGADRLVNAIAAHRRFGGPLIVVDFGTATTFDIIGEDGGYEGGIIAPGINLSVEALYMAAAKLPRVAVRKPEAVIGGSTVSAMESGIFWGYIGLIEGLVRRIKAEYGRDLSVVATGGLAPLFAEATEVIQEIDGDLTLRGLQAIYQANRRDAAS
jgi:type III pantothenate kinase